MSADRDTPKSFKMDAKNDAVDNEVSVLRFAEGYSRGNEARDFFNDPIAHLMRVYERHGCGVSPLPGRENVVFALGPELNKAVLLHPDSFHATGFLFPGPRGSAQRRLLQGVFNQNGDRHRDQRRLIMETFQKHVVDGYQETMTDECNRCLDRWRVGEVRDLSGELVSLLAQINGKLILGLDDESMVSQLAEVTEEWMALNTPMMLASMLDQTMDSTDYEHILACGERLESLMTAALDARRSSSLGGSDLLAGLLRCEQDAPGRLSSQEQIGQGAHLFAASNQSTRSALIWTLLLLTQHPEVMRRVFAELSEQSEAPGGKAGELTLLDCVVRESLRLFPPVSYYTRKTAEQLTLGGHTLRKGTIVVFSHYVTHRLPERFPDPQRFIPDRWRSVKPTPYEYLPFGVGPRACIGAAYAKQLISLVLPALLRRFTLTVVPGTRVDRRISTILTPARAIPMLLKPPGGPYVASPIQGNVHEMVRLTALAVAA